MENPQLKLLAFLLKGFNKGGILKQKIKFCKLTVNFTFTRCEDVLACD